jgi:deoxycytidylate deaminase/dephospho-CoA kinase
MLQYSCAQSKSLVANQMLTRSSITISRSQVSTELNCWKGELYNPCVAGHKKLRRKSLYGTAVSLFSRGRKSNPTVSGMKTGDRSREKPTGILGGSLSTATIIGITGSFGSGCTTFSRQLKEAYGFEGVKLSKYIVEEAKRRGKDLPGLEGAATELLQDIGDEFREKYHSGYLAECAINELAKQFPGHDKFVIDGIRNPGEIDYLRRYKNFYLLAVDCDSEERFRRLVFHGKYSVIDQEIFARDDLRDKGSDFLNGQQVLKCVEVADVFISNDSAEKTKPKYEKLIREVLEDYVNLLLGTKIREADDNEVMMSLASLFSLQSRCIKRQVGAVLIDEEANIISTGYNEVPGKELPCIDELGGCNRDFLKYEERKQWVEAVKHCYSCGSVVKKDGSCPKCHSNIDYPEPKMLDKCRAIHAEEAALLSATSRTLGSTLFTTTYPCMQCTKRIIKKGVGKVVYIDPYPDPQSIEMLEKAVKSGDILVERFQGVKASAFYRVFSRKLESLQEEAATGRGFFEPAENS